MDEKELLKDLETRVNDFPKTEDEMYAEIVAVVGNDRIPFVFSMDYKEDLPKVLKPHLDIAYQKAIEVKSFLPGHSCHFFSDLKKVNPCIV